MSKIAKTTGTPHGVVQRIVGKLDPAGVQDARKRQTEKAKQIDSLPISWSEKIARWTEETGQCETTLWRVLKKFRESSIRDA